MEPYYIEQVNKTMKETGMEFFLQQVSPNSPGTCVHMHDAIELLYIKEGNFKIFVNNVEYFLQKGDMILFRSNTIHRVYANHLPLNQYYVLKVKPSIFFELASEKNAVSYVLRFALSGMEGKTYWCADELAGGEIMEALKKLIIESADEGLCKDMSLKLCACQVMLGLLRDIIKYEEKNRINISANDSAATQIYKAIRNIHKNYTEEIDAGKYAKMVGMSYSYFSRCFKRITGRSFKEYVNEVRINHAEQLLLTTERSVTQISLECGYNNVSYFITVYKRLKGGTPYANKKHSRE